jgi:dynein heavy chain
VDEVYNVLAAKMNAFSLKFGMGEEVSVKCSESVLFYSQVATELELCSVAAKSIDTLRDGYRPAAKRGAILFFVLSDMAGVNYMYQYSLSAYMEVFTAALRKAVPDAIVSRRVANLISTLTKSVYDYGCTGEWKKV